MVYGSNDYEVDYSYMPRQQASGNTTNQIGTTTFVNKVSTYKLSGSTRTLESEEDIEYDSLGNITKYGNVTYKYDLCGRLVRENNPNLDRTIVWEYNTNNNIYVRAEYGYTTRDTLTTNELREARMLSYRNKWTDQLTSFKGYDITYDKAGNPTSYLGMTLGWTRGRLLQTVTKDGITYEYGYDGNGIRKKREVAYDNGNFMKHLYYYADGHIVSETRRGYMGAEVNQQIRYFYNQQGAVGMSYGGTHYLYRKNFFGDVIAIYDRSTCVARYTYDAFGVCKVRDANGKVNTDENFIGNINPIRYRGYYYDVETGFYYLQTRYHDPSACRFINADSLEYLDPETAGGLNLYAYCNGNPVMYVDPEGTAFWIFLFIAVTAIIGAGIAAAKAVDEGKEGWELVKDIAIGASIGVAAGGGAICLFSSVFGIAAGIKAVLDGLTAVQMFAIGALSFDFFAFIVAPLLNLEVEGIELETPSNNWTSPNPQPTFQGGKGGKRKNNNVYPQYKINPSNEKFINHFIYTKMKLLLMLKTIRIKSTHFIQIQLKRNSLRII